MKGDRYAIVQVSIRRALTLKVNLRLLSALTDIPQDQLDGEIEQLSDDDYDTLLDVLTNEDSRFYQILRQRSRIISSSPDERAAILNYYTIGECNGHDDDGISS